jgi:hypothetical protein
MTTLDQTTKEQIQEQFMRERLRKAQIKNSIDKQKKGPGILSKLPFHFSTVKGGRADKISKLRKKVESK